MKLFVPFRFNEKFLKVNEESYILLYSFIKKIINKIYIYIMYIYNKRLTIRNKIYNKKLKRIYNTNAVIAMLLKIN